MAEITAGAVKSLRDRTGAGMMDCKRALEETGGDEEAAIDLLRKRGAAKAAKRAGREVSEGYVHVDEDDGRAVMVEVLTETDFVARSDDFQAFARALADRVAGEDLPDGEVLEGEDVLERFGEGLRQELNALRARVGENVQLGRVVRFEVPRGNSLASYVHFGNRIGVLVELEGGEGSSAARDLARDVAMHAAAARPSGIRPEDLPEEVRDRERKLLREQAEGEGKPPQIVDKIVEGRMRKFYEENALLEQAFVRDPDRKVRDLLAAADGDLDIRRFVRFEVGDEG